MRCGLSARSAALASPAASGRAERQPLHTAALRGRILAAEYLGTTQIVTLDTAHGQVKARIGSDTVVRIGDQTGLRLDARAITLFAPQGRALLSVANQRVLAHG